MFDRGDDPRALGGDRSLPASRTTADGIVWPTRSNGPAARCRLGRQPVDLAQLLLEQVGAVETTVGLLDLGELCLLATGEVLRVLPERVAGALQAVSELALAGRGVPGSRRRGGPVERVGGAWMTWKASTHDSRSGSAQRPLPRSSRPYRAETSRICSQRSAPSSSRISARSCGHGRAGPYEPARVVVDDHRDVALPATMG